MKDIYKNYLIIGLTVLIVVLLVIIILLVLNKPNFSFFNNSNRNESEKLNNKEVDNNSSTDTESNQDNNATNNDNHSSSDNTNTNSNVDSNQTTDNTTNSNIDANKNTSNNSSASSSTNSNNQSNSSSNNPTNNASSEADVIAYFQNEEAMYSTYTNQDNSTFREKAKNGFITIVDFIFYGKEIKGYTFEGLTNSAKLQVIKIALTIDNKIEEYFPNYKTIIKDKYTDIKGKLAVKYLELTSSLCDAVGENTCNQFKEDFNNMKESFGFTWDLIKELAGSGKDWLKDFYENEFKN